MATIIDLGKLRFHFAGEYDAATEYEMNDIVKYGGNVYVYANVTKTTGNLPTNQTYWTLMVEGFKFRQVYDGATQYRVGDGITYGGKVYICILDTQGNSPPNATYWSQFADGIQWEGDYDISTGYQKNDLVKYGSQVYIAKQDTTGNLPTEAAYWDKFVEGVSPQGVYNAATAYTPGDIVAYGANLYRCTANSTGNLPTDTSYFENFINGNSFVGTWNNSTNYYVGETVRFGGNVYRAKIDNVNKQPDTNGTEWEAFSTGVNSRGNWASATSYAINDVVTYGGNTYIIIESHISGVFATDLAAGKWQKFNSGIRYMGNWTTSTNYLKDDIVKSSVSTYICIVDHQAGADFFIDLNTNNYWEEFVAGASYVLPSTTGNAGKYLQTPDGATYSWQFSGANDKIFYVAEDATSSADDVNHGSAIDYAFASVKYACDYIAADTANRTPATIFIKDGTYNEVLPITVPAEVTIVGDGQRNCIIQPAAGNGDNGIPNNEETMFFLDSGVMIEGILMKGLTGFQIGTPGDPTTSTVKGCFLRLKPGSTILKSPYIKESSAFSTGGVGAIVDGSVVATGTAGSMVFHTFTQVHDGGIGFWVSNNGLSEIVSCFTYYNDYGYVSTGGGKIRALNGNNSYGTYGALSAGFDTNEVASAGYIYGDTITYTASTLNTPEGFTVGDTLTYGGTTTTNIAISSISNEAQCTITTANPHGLAEGDMMSFKDVVPNDWAKTFGSFGTATMYNRAWYVDVVSATQFRICTNPDLTNYLDTRSINGWGVVTETITDATRSNPVILTITSHGYSNGDLVQNVSGILGMTQINGQSYYANNITANTVELYTDAGLTTTLDGTTFSAYVSGGTSERVLTGTAFTSGDTICYKEIKSTVANIQTNIQPAANHRLVVNDTTKGYTGKTIKVAVRNSGAGNRYVFDGEELGSHKMDTKHRLYIFEQNDLSNNNHPLYFSETQDGTHNSGIEFNPSKDAVTGLTGNAVEYYLDGVLQANLAAYNSGFNAATSREVWVVGAVPASNKLYAVCANHSGMGGGSGYSTNNAIYAPATGILILSIGAHNLNIGENVEITQDSIRFTCGLDGDGTNHDYPRSTDPAKTSIFVKIIDKSSTSITVNVGISSNTSIHNYVSTPIINNIQTSSSDKPTIVYNTTTQHSTADTHWERFSGMYRSDNTADGSTITAQDSQSATVALDGGKGQHGFSMVIAGLAEEPRPGASIEFVTGPTYNPIDNVDIVNPQNTGLDTVSYIVTTVSGYTASSDPTILGTCVVTLATEKPDTSDTYYGQMFRLRYKYSQVRLTGHDFLSIGTGGRSSTNYPGEPAQSASQGNEVTETYPGRVYYVSTDQDGNFRVGNYFRVDQSTGRATLDASAFDLSGLTSLRLGSIGAQLGESINEFSSDGSLSGNSNTSVPTEQAVKSYVDNTAISQSLLSTAGDILYRDASGAARLGVGNPGQVLVVNASGNSVEWGDSTGGGAATPYASSSTTEDVDGFVTAATSTGVGVSNVVYEYQGRAPIDDIDFGRYKRITGYTQTVGATTETVAITYKTNGEIDTLTVT